jgi:hypothetical protein
LGGNLPKAGWGRKAERPLRRLAKSSPLPTPMGVTRPSPVITTPVRSGLLTGALDMTLFAIMRAMTQTKKDSGARRTTASLPIALSVGALALVAGSGRAEAKLFEVFADAYVGGLYGTEPKFNSVVTQKPDKTMGNDFFADNSGGLLGLRAGVEIFYTDIYLQFDQMVTGRGFSGSTLQAMLGWDFGLGDGPWRGTLGAFGGMVFGFPYTPHFPIDNSQIATLGVAGEVQGGAERVLNRLFRLQIIGTVGYHYMFGGADSVVIDAQGNTQQTQTHGFHIMVKAGLRFNLGI